MELDRYEKEASNNDVDFNNHTMNEKQKFDEKKVKRWNEKYEVNEEQMDVIKGEKSKLNDQILDLKIFSAEKDKKKSGLMNENDNKQKIIYEITTNLVKAQQQAKTNATQKERINQKEMEGKYKYMWTMKISKR